MNTHGISQEDVNANPDCIATVYSAQIDWQASPSGTVWRKPLYRKGGEFGLATSLVRYAPQGRFRAHPHPAGEEILVLSGVFSDEHGDYPAGSWLFNPEGYIHTPYSIPGCELLVRLRQYPGIHRNRHRVNTHSGRWYASKERGLSLLPLYRETAYPEYVALARIDPGTSLPRLSLEAGLEYFVLDGILCNRDKKYPTGTWLRWPPSTAHTLYSATGALYYLRLTHGSGELYEEFEADLNQR